MIVSMATKARATTTAFGISSKAPGRDRRHRARSPSLDGSGLAAAPTVVVSLDFVDLTEPALRREVLKLRRRVQKRSALLRLALAFATNLRVSSHRRAPPQRTRRDPDPARRGSGPRVSPIAGAVLRFLRVSWASVDVGHTLDHFGAPSDASDASAAEFERWHGQCQQIARFIVCAGTFFRQRLAIVEQARAERHARKRIAAAGWSGEPVVSVVHLREREKRPAAGETAMGTGRDRTYRHRWIVQAHTRQQWYPSLETHLPILIGPYIKGPEDKPLKPRTTPIFMVDR
jgi:hypothetical protein